MIGKLDCQSIVIRQFLKLQLEKCLTTSIEQQIVRLPLLAYQYSKQIFKRETLVAQYLVQLLQQIFYLHDISELNQEKSEELSNLYLQVHIKHDNHKTFYLSQFFIRCLLLGLSIKIQQPQLKVFRNKFKSILKKMQLELILGTGAVLSEIVIKELQILKPEFECLEYYEELKRMFQKCDVEKVEIWIQDALQELRKKSQVKRQSIVPFQADTHKMEVEPVKKDSINEPDNNNKTETKTEEQNHSKNNGSLKKKVRKEVKSKTVGKEHRVVTLSKDPKVSCISLANKMRQSLPGPSSRYSSKYTFKSIKKSEMQEGVTETDDETPSPCLQQHFSYYPTCKTQGEQLLQKQEQEDSSKFLCEATPPRRNARQERE